jgi:hypothetical protein
MAKRFKVGDHVSWNSEAGRVSGRIIKVHTAEVGYKGYTSITPVRMNRNMKSRAIKPITSLCTKDRPSGG